MERRIDDIFVGAVPQFMNSVSCLDHGRAPSSPAPSHTSIASNFMATDAIATIDEPPPSYNEAVNRAYVP